MTSKPFYKELYFQVIVGIVIGVSLGYFFPDLAVKMKPLGDGFIKLIAMIIGPIIFCTVVTGIAGMRDMKELGRVGGKALIYFAVMSIVALIIGLIGGHVIQPGAGFNVELSTLDTSAISKYTESAKEVNVVTFVMGIIPSTFVSAFSSGNVLAILMVSILFGYSLSAIGEKGRPVFQFVESASRVFFHNVHLISKLSSIGAFGAIAYTIGAYGLASLIPLVKMVFGFYLLLIVFVVVVYGAVASVCRFSLFAYLRFIKEELLIILGTGSSSVVLPHLMEKVERMGCPKPVVALVIPSGYSFNLNGTNLYMTMAILFIAQATNTELSFSSQMILILVAMLTSKGAAGVTGAAFVMLTSTLIVLPVVPVAGMVLILGIHRFVGTGLAIVNLIGNGIAAIAVSAWDGVLDKEQMRQTLNTQSKNSAVEYRSETLK
ncbi:TPA: C4-dicarboxylate transporter DctA [Citrobacter amalonaticus]|uniref:C4-dicarboxylate transporter DctA n=1 Tax=Citrobacter telavivensis TaxID=2653932 RepID=A0A6L5ECI7_9ENTR|nr:MULTISPECIES: C4-dicarboxylate transporter DctA [Citrobacter]EKZ2526022.1 C4-dicarboxylate transporter DctA [Citrobacter farmeri]HCL6628629.1 C4-dicarboxylate transporter DctA [Citrobacter amalonaticus]MDM2734923.1 C4-dicarboxylate transporter DctA [Citrobacter sp. Ct235]MPQ53066.1 C4-dicarboxylate transporter DctA [Citrobacter telavivensis]QFS73792.1 C4-dicarboxylate transporter DctA [Citrobacter telavivensis]